MYDAKKTLISPYNIGEYVSFLGGKYYLFEYDRTIEVDDRTVYKYYLSPLTPLNHNFIFDQEYIINCFIVSDTDKYDLSIKNGFAGKEIFDKTNIYFRDFSSSQEKDYYGLGNIKIALGASHYSHSDNNDETAKYYLQQDLNSGGLTLYLSFFDLLNHADYSILTDLIVLKIDTNEYNAPKKSKIPPEVIETVSMYDGLPADVDWEHTTKHGPANVQDLITLGNDLYDFIYNDVYDYVDEKIPSNMTGATDSAAGSSGLVPTPAAGDQDKYLKGDGTWSEVAGGVTGVKGGAESSYRSGDVNITLGNLGVTATAAELNYVDGVTSDIQEQLDNKLSTTGVAASATKLENSKTIRTDLSSTSAASFNGTENITPGITGVLSITNGGTGADTAEDALANLGAEPAFSYLSVAKGGTGATDAATARANLGITLANLGITATATELNYMDGVTSSVQTQLNGKLSTSGTAASATQLANARAIQTNLASTSKATFDGTKNINPGVTGTLGIANGGTGATTAAAALAALLPTGGTEGQVLMYGGVWGDAAGGGPDIIISDQDLVAGESELASGTIYLVYE